MTDTQADAKTPVDFWFDPLCPWAWMTSRWMAEVEKVRDVRVRWRPMSLVVLNEDKLDQLPEEYRAQLGPVGLRPIRVVVAAEQKHGPEVTGKLYAALGTRIHNEGLGNTTEVIAAALAEVGLPAELIEFADSDAFDAELRASHAAGIDKVGQDVGTPIISVPGPRGEDVAFFGPVVTPTPKGEDAARLWDGTLLVAATPGFYEIKRSRTEGPSFA
ncbi:DsbA family protein [Streptomyces sp. NPDC097619]|uniref:mycothiol-dependent nitroreductase Rv2466c family protein n=1 Tax=Streptomyces sp. NPDC097619 TaxID=3157228 RepID=UPI00332C875D